MTEGELLSIGLDNANKLIVEVQETSSCRHNFTTSVLINDRNVTIGENGTKLLYELLERHGFYKTETKDTSEAYHEYRNHDNWMNEPDNDKRYDWSLSKKLKVYMRYPLFLGYNNFLSSNLDALKNVADFPSDKGPGLEIVTIHPTKVIRRGYYKIVGTFGKTKDVHITSTFGIIENGKPQSDIFCELLDFDESLSNLITNKQFDRL